MSVLVTGASGFVGAHCSLALRKRGDGVVGIDNFNAYYDPSLKKARKALLASHGVYVVEGDINDGRLLAKLFDVVPFTHVLHLARPRTRWRGVRNRRRGDGLRRERSKCVVCVGVSVCGVGLTSGGGERKWI